jgi:hypothetical protein
MPRSVLPDRPMPRRRPNHRHWFDRSAVLATVAMLACGGGDASKEIETLQSWRATIDLAANARLRGWVTSRYVSQLRDEARDALKKSDSDKSSEKASAAQRDSLDTARRDLETSLAKLERLGT